MLIFNANQLNSLQEIFVTVLTHHLKLVFLAFRAYLLEPPPQDYITKEKTMKTSTKGISSYKRESDIFRYVVLNDF